MLEKQTVEFKPKVYEVVSNSDPSITYLVSHYRPTKWSCTCKGYVYHSHNDEGYSKNYKCTHIKDTINKIKKGELE